MVRRPSLAALTVVRSAGSVNERELRASELALKEPMAQVDC